MVVVGGWSAAPAAAQPVRGGLDGRSAAPSTPAAPGRPQRRLQVGHRRGRVVPHKLSQGRPVRGITLQVGCVRGRADGLGGLQGVALDGERGECV